MIFVNLRSPVNSKSVFSIILGRVRRKDSGRPSTVDGNQFVSNLFSCLLDLELFLLPRFQPPRNKLGEFGGYCRRQMCTIYKSILRNVGHLT